MVGTHQKALANSTKNLTYIIKNSITLLPLHITYLTKPFLLLLHLSQDITVNASTTSQHDLPDLPARQDIVWWKVYDEDYESRRHGRRGRSRYFPGDDYPGPRPGYRRPDGHPRYRFRYRRHFSDHHYRSPRQFDFRPGRVRGSAYINGFGDWYTRKRFHSSLRVFTRGDV